MFSVPMIDSLVQRFTPHAITLRDECRSWATAVIDRLDRIGDELGSDDIYSLRRPVVGNAAAGTVTAHMVEALLVALPQGGDR